MPATLDRTAQRIGQADLADYVGGLIAAACAIPDLSLVHRTFRVGRSTVGVRFSDPDLVHAYSTRLYPGDLPPDSHVDVLESKPLQWPPLARWSDPTCDRRCFHRTLAPDLRAAYPHTRRLWEVASASKKRAVQIAESVGDLPPWDSGAPLRTPLHWICVDKGWRLVHGGTLGVGRRAILIVGPGGAGKSGTTLSGIAHGLQTVGDDYVLIEPASPPIARAVYRLVKQDRRGVGRIAGLEAKLAGCRPNWQGKLEFDPAAVFPGSVAESQEIVAVVTPAIGAASSSRIESLPANETMQLLARATLEQFHSERESGLFFCLGLSKQLPAFRLMLSADPAEIASVVRRFVEEFAG